jgi:hypothetical protein
VFRDEVPLEGWPLQTPAVISSVSDRSPVVLRELERLGLMRGTALVVERRNAAGSLAIKLESRPDLIRVSNDLARSILVAQSPATASPAPVSW